MSDDVKLSLRPATQWRTSGVLLLMFIVSIAVKATVLSWLWNWYIVPLGLPPLRLIYAFGIIITVNFMRPVPEGTRSNLNICSPLIPPSANSR